MARTGVAEVFNEHGITRMKNEVRESEIEVRVVSTGEFRTISLTDKHADVMISVDARSPVLLAGARNRMNSKSMQVMTARTHDEWGTPKELFKALDEEFHFTLDPCASDSNHKCDRYFTKDDNGLEKSWGGQNVFCNPPYSKIRDWAKKCCEESRRANVIVMLSPARVDTRWFHNYVYGKAEIRFLMGRLRYEQEDGTPSENPAPFPAMIAIYRRE